VSSSTSGKGGKQFIPHARSFGRHVIGIGMLLCIPVLIAMASSRTPEKRAKSAARESSRRQGAPAVSAERTQGVMDYILTPRSLARGISLDVLTKKHFIFIDGQGLVDPKSGESLKETAVLMTKEGTQVRLVGKGWSIALIRKTPEGGWIELPDSWELKAQTDGRWRDGRKDRDWEIIGGRTQLPFPNFQLRPTFDFQLQPGDDYYVIKVN